MSTRDENGGCITEFLYSVTFYKTENRRFIKLSIIITVSGFDLRINIKLIQILI